MRLNNLLSTNLRYSDTSHRHRSLPRARKRLTWRCTTVWRSMFRWRRAAVERAPAGCARCVPAENKSTSEERCFLARSTPVLGRLVSLHTGNNQNCRYKHRRPHDFRMRGGRAHFHPSRMRCRACVWSHLFVMLQLRKVLAWKVHFGKQVYIFRISKSNSHFKVIQGQGHRIKKPVCVSCLRVVCLLVKGKSC